MKGINYLLATFFYCGYFPKAPGTFASFIAGLLGYIVLKNSGISYLFFLFLLVTLLGFLTSGNVANLESEEDPSIVVIDEASGVLFSMLIVALFLKSFLYNFLLSFVFFRVYDISKVFPVNKMEKIKGGSGIMLDDLVAGAMAALTILILSLLLGKIE